ncbi:MAG: erythromycin esterase family protein, partial [Planctomycetota bacterium]
MIRIGQHRVSYFAAWWLTLLTAFVGSASDAHADFEAELSRTALQNLDDPATLDAIAAQLAKYQLVGLGETTHGQAEMFDLRRRPTMLLVRDHGFRTVYYETGGAAATQLDRYIAGGDLTLDQAMQFGFDLLVWQNAENAALLEDLRAWNASADEVDR